MAIFSAGAFGADIFLYKMRKIFHPKVPSSTPPRGSKKPKTTYSAKTHPSVVPNTILPEPTRPATLFDPTRPDPSRPNNFKYEQRELKTKNVLTDGCRSCSVQWNHQNNQSLRDGYIRPSGNNLHT